MKHTRADGQTFTIPGGTTDVIFPSHPHNEQTIAVVKTDGVYPEKGYAVNDLCTETIYIIKGELLITVDDKEETVREGELLMILPGQKYCIRGKAEALDVITPAWDSEQNHIICKNCQRCLYFSLKTKSIVFRIKLACGLILRRIRLSSSKKI